MMGVLWRRKGTEYSEESTLLQMLTYNALKRPLRRLYQISNKRVKVNLKTPLRTLQALLDGL
jgi:hypothetical protein